MDTFFGLAGLIIHCIIFIYGNENIAFKKRAQQSSVMTQNGKVNHDQGPDAGVDGYTYPSHPVGPVGVHTSYGDVMPWWAVYLEELYAVSVITFYARKDCCFYQMSKITIDVIRPTKCMCDKWEALQTGVITTCHYQMEGVSFLNSSCPPNTVGSFVRIQRNGEFMSFCEVQVFGELLPGTKENVNSACGLKGMTYTGRTVTKTTARSNIECVTKCVINSYDCKVATYKKESKTCIYTSKDCSATSIKSDDSSNVYLIE